MRKNKIEPVRNFVSLADEETNAVTLSNRSLMVSSAITAAEATCPLWYKSISRLDYGPNSRIISKLF